MALDHEHFMDIALELSRKSAAQGNRPLGSLLVDAGGKILSQGGNTV
jgi:tRNA(Arg) A34 adenosine deaminase TadA